MVITGEDSAVNKAALAHVSAALADRGHTVLTVPDPADDLMKEHLSAADFHRQTAWLLLARETACRLRAMETGADKAVILSNRGMPDIRAAMAGEDRRGLFREIGLDEVTARDAWDAVFFLRADHPRDARGEEEHMAAWVGHTHLRIVSGSDKERLLREVLAFLGDPRPVEIERKYLIQYPDAAFLRAVRLCHPVEIAQTYLKSENGIRERIRRRGEDGHYAYFRTRKKKISPLIRIEEEERIAAGEYEALKSRADPKRQEICKTRYCLVWENQYFEIDVFPFWTDQALMEIELLDENQPVILPPFIRVIREVTDEKEYSNSALARQLRDGSLTD